MNAEIPATEIPAGNYKQIALNYATPSGYSAIAALSYYTTGSAAANVFAYNPSSILIANQEQTAITIRGTVSLLLKKG